jgi:hypothetical protein
MDLHVPDSTRKKATNNATKLENPLNPLPFEPQEDIDYFDVLVHH